MHIRNIRRFLGYCTLFGYLLLLVWTVLFLYAHNWHFGLTKNWFPNLSVEAYDNVMLMGMAGFKIIVVTFFLIPFLAAAVCARGDKE